MRDTLRGQSRPNRVSWGLWALAPLISTVAALSAHADIWATSRTFIAGFMPLLVFFASFINPRSYWKLETFDVLCGIFSVLALVVWGLTRHPELAIVLAVLADAFAALPTIRKSWLYPETESGITFALGFAAVLLVLPSVPKWDIQNAAFQLYILLADGTLALLIYRKRLTAIFKSP